MFFTKTSEDKIQYVENKMLFYDQNIIIQKASRGTLRSRRILKIEKKLII